MHPKTKAGFAPLNDDSNKLTTFKVAGKSFKVHRDAALPFKNLAEYFDRVIEPLDEPGWEGGHNKRPIPGTEWWSEHAAGMAVDFNASQHGRVRSMSGFTAMQLQGIEWFLRNTASGRLMEWGGTWNNVDWMHFQVRSPEKLAEYCEKYGRLTD